jgi:hypothetical protein
MCLDPHSAKASLIMRIMLPTVTVQQLREAMPKYQATAHAQAQLPHGTGPLSLELRIRCALADYILNSKEGTLADRVYGLVAGMPIDVDEAQKQSA